MGKFRTPHVSQPQKTRGQEKEDPAAQCQPHRSSSGHTVSDGHGHQDRRVPYGRRSRGGSSRRRSGRWRRMRRERRRLPGHDGGEPESRHDEGGEVGEEVRELGVQADALPHQHLHQHRRRVPKELRHASSSSRLGRLYVRRGELNNVEGWIYGNAPSTKKCIS
ncbi:hypothetical protein EUGRSUZ_A00649 [Eucalyptus grandis]|uniref:Uncharacterized protein n=2 Tax=Eucalyptus grandis TaxID=71139 RepID=A0ACC3M174_EUCGR|nr:hypothetical protein EUGRSUZ_A00649 [Eucalyptus grandis]